MENAPLTDEKLKQAKNLTMIIYGLYAASFIVGITCIVAIIVNFIKKNDVAGTWLESHFRWQIRTFWFSVLWTIIGFITFIIAIGWFILAANCIWFIYRLVKGFINLNDNKPMYAD
ncbi:MAG: hypothetical protein H7Z73_04235 [Candidatus Saccharibacteria bacterium]|nr:hypothetical protein [Moraxellaceae bacterium]